MIVMGARHISFYFDIISIRNALGLNAVQNSCRQQILGGISLLAKPMRFNGVHYG